MAKRTVALCNEKYIGIESIYTVIDGQQINIPEKLKDLRIKSRKGELFCPCGCRTNLILVAGDKNLRKQHFREKPGTGKYECTMPTESQTSIDSKIVLKCWLDDKLNSMDIESRVPIDSIEDTKRKPEFSFLSRRNKLGIRYWKTRANILEDRLDVLSENMVDITVLYIVDSSNGGTEGQYPEALMKIQNKQQYCLLLEIKGQEYDKAIMKAVFYEKDIDGFWVENVFVEGKLSDYNISKGNNLYYEDKDIEAMMYQSKRKFNSEQEREKERREETERIRQEREAKYQETLKKFQSEIERKRAEEIRQAELKRQEEERLKKEQEEREELERKEQQEKKEQEKLLRKAKIQNEIDDYLQMNPKVKQLFEYFQYNTCLSGVALCRQSNGKIVNRRFTLNNITVSIDSQKEYILLTEELGNKVYVFWNNNPEQNVFKINSYYYIELDEQSENYISEFLVKSSRK